jgi:hypothetical protein
VIADLAAVDLHGLTEPALLVHTERVLEVQNRLDAISVRVLQACDVREVTVGECGRQTRAWLVEAQRLSPTDAGRRMWVARHLPLFPAVAAAFNAGQINFEHVRVILECLLKLSPEWRAASEGQLLDFAREHDPGMRKYASR